MVKNLPNEKLLSYIVGIRGDIHTQVATLNVNMTLESETSSVATNIPSFRRKTKKSYS